MFELDSRFKLTLIAIYGLSLLLFAGTLVLRGIKISEDAYYPQGETLSLSNMASHELTPKHTVFGFLPYWSLEQARFLQLDKLTDVAYFALHIEPNGHFRKVQEDGSEHPGYLFWRKSETLTDLIERGAEVGTSFSLTVISHEDEVTDAFLNCRSCWNTFITALKKELAFRKIKNVNLDFEYVEFTNDWQAPKYTEFTQFVNNKLDEKFGESKVTVSTFADSLQKPRITDVEELAKVSDGLFIMAYDFHRPTSETAGPISPIGGAPTYTEYDIETMLTDYLANIPPNKLILGVPYYGYNWVVTNAAPYAERIPGDDLIGYSGSQTYADIMETTLEYKPNILWNDIGKAPHFTYTSNSTGSLREVYFENVASLQYKYTLIKELDLQGVGIWALGYDRGYQELWELLEAEFPQF